MLPIELISKYIKDIPWEQFPLTFNNESPMVYKAVLETVFDLTPSEDCSISFNDNKWDFRPYYKHKNRSDFMLNFDKLVPEELVFYSKFYVVSSILEKNSPATAKHRIRYLKSILKDANERYNHDSVYLVTTDEIISIIESKGLKPETSHFYYTCVYEVWSFLIEVFKLDIPVDIDAIHNKALHYSHLAENFLESNKLPDIPIKLYNKIVEKTVEVMRDESKDYLDRAFSCLLLIGSQLGLRLGDLKDLRINNLKSIVLENSQVSAYFIHYTAGKPSKGFGPMYEFDMYCTDLCKEAYETLTELRKSHPLYESTNHLYLSYNRQKKKDTPLTIITKYPINTAKFNDEYERFVYKYLRDECSQEWTGIKPRKLPFLRGVKELKEEAEDMYYVPDFRQYRVRVCTGLANRGVPLSYIKKFMGHLSEEMLGYYVRKKDSYKENLDYAAKVIQTMVGEDSTPIGINGESLKQRLKDFVSSNKYNVYDDINEIIEKLGNKLVIRAKSGGACIKTSLIPCADEALSNKLLCTYNLCPNVYHFFWMIDVTYLDFTTAKTTYETTLANGYTNEATKQQNVIRSLIQRRLSPEIEALNKAIETEGLKTIIEKYPTLVPVIDSIDKIKEEIKQWK